MDKRGMSTAVLWIVRIIMLIIIVAVINFIKTAALDNALNTYDVEFYIANTKLLYSPTGLAYQSPSTGRTYPGIIDLEDFNDTLINESMTRDLPLRLILMELDKSVVKEVYYRKDRYDLLRPLIFAKQYDLMNKTYYILINDEGQLKAGLLNVEMVISR